MGANSLQYPLLFSQSHLFVGMSQDALIDLFHNGKVLQCKPGAEILPLGVRVSGLHVMLEGTSVVVKNGVTVRQVGFGGFFGERAILGIGVGATAQINALTDCVVWVVERTVLDDWFKANPGTDGVFYKRLCLELGHRLYSADM